MTEEHLDSMHIFFWFLIIAALALTTNIILLLQMKKKNSIHLAPVAGVTAGSYLLAFCLYILVMSHGTDVLAHTLAASFTIDPQSYETAAENGQTIYSFRCSNGIPFRFDAASLLSDSSDLSGSAMQSGSDLLSPATVDVYSCQVRTGFGWCYLNHGTQVRYALH